MADIVDKVTRSKMMAGIKGADTQPELVIRKALHSMGFRYRLHVKKLPGKPDLVFPKYKAIVLINGCFWHGHECHLFKWPRSRPQFWREKIGANQARDSRNMAFYLAAGWRVLVIWECALKGKRRIPLDELITAVAGWLEAGADCVELSGESLTP